MKAILPILICSAISAALGYYFGHITVPADLTTGDSVPASAPESNDTFAAATDTGQPDGQAVEDSFEPSPMPVQEEPEPEPEPTEPDEPVVETNTATTPSEDDFAARADKTINTLTDTQGRTINASIVKVLDTEVRIRRSDGLVTTIPLNMLSEEDIAFCNYLREQQEAEAVKPPDTSDGFDWDAYFNS